MQQIELFQIDSPCRGICENSAKGFCRGCLRSREERYYWHKMNEADKRKVLQLCQQRWQRLIRARHEALENNTHTPLPYGMTAASLFEDLEPEQASFMTQK